MGPLENRAHLQNENFAQYYEHFIASNDISMTYEYNSGK